MSADGPVARQNGGMRGCFAAPEPASFRTRPRFPALAAIDERETGRADLADRARGPTHQGPIEPDRGRDHEAGRAPSCRNVVDDIDLARAGTLAMGGRRRGMDIIAKPIWSPLRYVRTPAVPTPAIVFKSDDGAPMPAVTDLARAGRVEQLARP